MGEKLLDFLVTNGENVIYEHFVDSEGLVNIEIGQSQEQSVKSQLGAFGKDPVRVL
ncbi:MAG: hypothetical protein ACETWT_15580 [Thermodesulfobacteriota bacterium]